MSSSPDPKAMAKALRTQLRTRHHIELTHGQCLEIVAGQHGVADWNVLAARARHHVPYLPWQAVNATIPVLRIFSVDAALRFYVDFLGFHLDFGGPAGGAGTPYYGQVSRADTSLHLTEVSYDPGPGATILLWINGIDALRADLNDRREHVRVWGPAIWAPEIENAPWGARVLTVADPFGNHLRFNEPEDPAARSGLPEWTPSSAFVNGPPPQ